MNLTWKQVCESAKINESTGRFYKNKFKPYFTSSGEGRHKKYSLEAVELLVRIKKLYSEGLDEGQVRTFLDEIYGVPVTNLITQEHMGSSVAVQQETIEVIRSIFQEEISRLEKKINELKTDQRTHDEELMQTMRVIQEQNSKPWWKKVFKK